MFAFWSLIFYGLVPILADISFLKSPIVSEGQHFIPYFLPILSFTITSISTGAYELWTSLPSLIKSITLTCFTTGKYIGLYSKQ